VFPDCIVELASFIRRLLDVADKLLGVVGKRDVVPSSSSSAPADTFFLADFRGVLKGHIPVIPKEVSAGFGDSPA